MQPKEKDIVTLEQEVAKNRKATLTVTADEKLASLQTLKDSLNKYKIALLNLKDQQVKSKIVAVDDEIEALDFRIQNFALNARNTAVTNANAAVTEVPQIFGNKDAQASVEDAVAAMRKKQELIAGKSDKQNAGK